MDSLELAAVCAETLQHLELLLQDDAEQMGRSLGGEALDAYRQAVWREVAEVRQVRQTVQDCLPQ